MAGILTSVSLMNDTGAWSGIDSVHHVLTCCRPKWEMMWRAWKLSQQSAASTSQNLPDGAASISEGFGPATEESTSGTAA